ncbi:MAG TPA: hypothetical protein PKN09_09280 [Novosphingobium sp.]|nr:hypothetical protein [Novosphingobium sp.]
MDRRKSIVLIGALAALGAVLAWAWSDGGLRPVTPQDVPAMLPGTAQ